MSHHQHKDRERAREYGRQATTHTRPSITKTKKRIVTSFHHQNKERERERRCVPPSPKQNEREHAPSNNSTHKAMHHPNKKIIIMYQGKNNDHIIRLLTQNTKREKSSCPTTRTREREGQRDREHNRQAKKKKPFNTTTKK